MKGEKPKPMPMALVWRKAGQHPTRGKRCVACLTRKADHVLEVGLIAFRLCEPCGVALADTILGPEVRGVRP